MKIALIHIIPIEQNGFYHVERTHLKKNWNDFQNYNKKMER